jgi:hypothetical protein
LPGLADPHRALAGYRAIPAAVDGGRLGENAPERGQPRDGKAITESSAATDGGEQIRIDYRASRVRWAALQILAFTCGAVVVASVARAQVIRPQDIPVGLGARAQLLLQIAGNGPATFADLAEKVLPAVIGVTTKVPIARHGGLEERLTSAVLIETPGAEGRLKLRRLDLASLSQRMVTR